MSKPDTKQQPTVTLHIVPGKGSEYQKKLFRAFWKRLISECRRELKAGQQAAQARQSEGEK